VLIFLLFYCDSTYALHTASGRKDALEKETKKTEMKALMDDSVREYMEIKEEKRKSLLREFKGEWEDLSSPDTYEQNAAMLQTLAREADKLYLKGFVGDIPEKKETKIDPVRVKSPSKK